MTITYCRSLPTCSVINPNPKHSLNKSGLKFRILCAISACSCVRTSSWYDRLARTLVDALWVIRNNELGGIQRFQSSFRARCVNPAMPGPFFLRHCRGYPSLCLFELFMSSSFRACLLGSRVFDRQVPSSVVRCVCMHSGGLEG